MQTDDLIARLSGGLEPVRGTEVTRTLGIGLAAGIAGSAACKKLKPQTNTDF